MVFSGCFLTITLRLDGDSDDFFEGDVDNTLFRFFVGVLGILAGELGKPGKPGKPGEQSEPGEPGEFNVLVGWKK